jgi:hypothetical protein
MNAIFDIQWIKLCVASPTIRGALEELAEGPFSLPNIQVTRALPFITVLL